MVFSVNDDGTLQDSDHAHGVPLSKPCPLTASPHPAKQNGDIPEDIESLRFRARAYDTLLKLVDMNTSSVQELVEYILEEALHATGSAIGYMHFINEDQASLHLFTWSKGVRGACYAEETTHYPIEVAGVWVDCIRNRRPVIHNDYPALPDKKGYPQGHIALQRHMSVPIMEGERILAVIGVGNKVEPYTDVDADKLLVLGRSMWSLVQRKRAEESQRETRDQLAAILEGITDSVYVVDGHGRIVFANTSAARSAGYPSAEVMAQDYPSGFRERFEILDESGRLLSVDQLPVKQARSGKPSGPITVCLHDRVAGTYRWKLLETTPILDASHTIRFLVNVAHDITEQMQAEEARRERDRLQAALEKETDLNTFKDAVMRTISHEFRTPLAIMRMASELLSRYFDRLDSQQRKEKLETINQQVGCLSQMVDEVAAAIQDTTEDLVLAPDYVDLKHACEQQIEAFLLTDAESRIVELTSAGDLSHAYVDVRFVNRILANLLSNADKYSDQETPIAVKLSADDDYVVLQVIDHGIGISAEDQEHLFEPFFRASNVGRIRGTGLGLSTVLQYVKLHNGIIGVESRLNEGSVFTVRLPQTPMALEPVLPDSVA